MDERQLVPLLQDALARLDVAVRIERMPDEARIRGGLCTVRGHREVIVSPDSSVGERIDILVRALRQLDTDSLYLPPVIREKLAEPTRE